MFLQIVGEIRAARNALMQVTTKLRSYIYREMSAPIQMGSINVHGSISPAKGSPRGLYAGNDLPMPIYQQAPQMATSWHSKVSLKWFPLKYYTPDVSSLLLYGSPVFQLWLYSIRFFQDGFCCASHINLLLSWVHGRAKQLPKWLIIIGNFCAIWYEYLYCVQ